MNLFVTSSVRYIGLLIIYLSSLYTDIMSIREPHQDPKSYIYGSALLFPV